MVYIYVFSEEKGVEASIDGVLGGYGHVNEADIKDSEAFLNTLLADCFPDSGRNQHLVALGNLFYHFALYYYYDSLVN